MDGQRLRCDTDDSAFSGRVRQKHFARCRAHLDAAPPMPEPRGPETVGTSKQIQANGSAVASAKSVVFPWRLPAMEKHRIRPKPSHPYSIPIRRGRENITGQTFSLLFANFW